MLQVSIPERNLFVLKGDLAENDHRKFRSEIQSELRRRFNDKGIMFDDDPAFNQRIIENNVKNRLEYIKTHKLFRYNPSIHLDGDKASNCSDKVRCNIKKYAEGTESRKVFSIQFLGSALFPAFQFVDGERIRAIREILLRLPEEMSDWEIAFWFDQRNVWLGGKSPQNSLSNETAVIDAAKQYSERRKYH